MTHLVLGGTGTVGSAVVRRLITTGDTVKVLTRSAEKGASLPKGAQSVVGDLADPATYGDIFQGFDTIFLLNALNATELQEGLAALNESRRARAKRLVYLSVHRVEQGPGVPHFASKIAIEDAIKKSGIPYTILRPNNFYQNDYWFKEVILNYGIYPQPIGEVGLSRVDVEDIAEAAVNALRKSGFENRTYSLVGPESLTGVDCARAWSEALGRDIKYAGNDLEPWTKANLAYLPHWLVYDFALMYAMFQKEGLVASASDLKECEQIVGHAPRKFGDFVKSTATAWNQPAVVR